MVSRDMKALGMYLSGSISFGVCPQSGKRLSIENAFIDSLHSSTKCTTAPRQPGQSVLRNIDAALEVTNGGPRARRSR